MTKRKLSRLALSLTVMALLVGLGAVGGWNHDTASPSQPRALPVETLVIERADSYTVRRTYTGILKARQASEIGFELSGKLQRVLVEDGDQVTAGQRLAELDVESIAARRAEMEAERSQALALLAELEAGPRQEQIAAARSAVDDLRAQWQLAKSTRERWDQLRAKNVVSQEDYEQQVFGLQAAQARLEAAQRRLDELEAGTRKEQVDAQRAVIARLDAVLERIDLERDDCHLAAPFDGMIAARYLDPGTVVSPGTPVLRILERSNLEAWFGLPPHEAAELHPGQRLTLQVGGRTYEGSVLRLLPELDPVTRTRDVVVQIAGSPEELVPGLVVRTGLELENPEPGFWVPAAALTRGDRGLWSVLAVVSSQDPSETTVNRRDVEWLHSKGERVFVRGTLTAGDQIVVGGTHRLVAGQRVEVVASHSAASDGSHSLAVN